MKVRAVLCLLALAVAAGCSRRAGKTESTPKVPADLTGCWYSPCTGLGEGYLVLEQRGNTIVGRGEMMMSGEWYGSYKPFALSGLRSGTVVQLVVRSPIRVAQTNVYEAAMERDGRDLWLTWARKGSEKGVFDPLALMRLRKLSNEGELESCLFPGIKISELWTNATPKATADYIRQIDAQRGAWGRQCQIQRALLLPGAVPNTLLQPVIQRGLNDPDADVRSNTVKLIEWLKQPQD